MKIEIFEESSYAMSAARYIADAIAEIAENEISVALCGGSTPKPIYEALAYSLESDPRLKGKKLLLFLGDERFVPLTDSRSNYKMIIESGLGDIQGVTALAPLDISSSSVQEASDRYEELVKGLQRPIDIMLLGVGDDGHTASLFPGDVKHLEERKRLCIAVKHPTDGTERMSMTFPVLEQSRKIFFLAKGQGKAKILHEVIRTEQTVTTYPSSFWKRCDDRVSFLVDTPAAALL